MEVIADLHVHSRYSIATGQTADLEHLDLWGRYKGVQVVGTGDCTHPEWLKELTGKLLEVDPGTYQLKPELALPLNIHSPLWDTIPPVRFLITGEISTIYKQADKVRKVHLLLVLSGLAAAHRLAQRLSRLGNIAADGRPTFGLAARHLVPLVLELDPEALVIPAHIWTPWFSVLGAKSGFDSLAECFAEVLPHIYAVETGLSSDPPMNWRVSELDRFLLVSNSDAHSPAKLAREANIFTVAPTFAALRRAICSQSGFAGTLEFFPQEGKYHLDGHRKCNLRVHPQEAQKMQGLCPLCGKPLTLGVLHRVLELADRPAGVPSPQAKPFTSLISLPEIIGEVLGVGPATKPAGRLYFRLLEKLGPELDILRHLPLETLCREGGRLLAYAVDKMRRGDVHIAGGYDGVYGEIRLLDDKERAQVQGQTAFWLRPAEVPAPPPEDPAPATKPMATAKPLPKPASPPAPSNLPPLFSSGNFPPRVAEPPPALEVLDHLLAGLNATQRAVVTHQGPPLIVQAGPGTGKTRALTHRLAYLLRHRQVPPQDILALTFTRQAAGEMRQRLERLLPGFPGLEQLTISTFHALGHQLLAAHSHLRQVADEDQRRRLLQPLARQWNLPLGTLAKQISLWKQQLLYPQNLDPDADPLMVQAFRHYEAALAEQHLFDYEDLIAQPVCLLSQDPELKTRYCQRWRHILVDEYQDLNEAQYRLLRVLAGPQTEIMVIGDPNQAIYGFRGASPRYFFRFQADWPEAVTITLTQTYRLPPTILEASRQVLLAGGLTPPSLATHLRHRHPVLLLETSSPAAEAQAVARHVERLVGGLSHLTLEDDQVRYQEAATRVSFRDIAVLYRLHSLGRELATALNARGIPCQQAKEGVGPDWDNLDLLADRVKLLSLHAAKGLEFPYVFIVGCEDGLIPYRPEGEEPHDPAEEVRLFYVGLTRAARQVILSRSRRRSLWGKPTRTRLSPLAAATCPEKAPFACPSADSARRRPQPSLFPELARPRRSSPR